MYCGNSTAGGECLLTGSITKNTAVNGGGCYYENGKVSNLSSLNVNENKATSSGGGIYVAEGSIQISESNFDECMAKGTSSNQGGGAIYIVGDGTYVSPASDTLGSGDTPPIMPDFDPEPPRDYAEALEEVLEKFSRFMPAYESVLNIFIPNFPMLQTALAYVNQFPSTVNSTVTDRCSRSGCFSG